MYFSKKKQLNLGKKAKIVTKKKQVPLELKPLPELIKIADKLFAKEVKKRHEKNGYCHCVTCSKAMTNDGNKNLHCGHFVTRSVMKIRWDFDNARPQCAQCNMFKQGKPIQFEIALVRELGEERVKELKSIGAKAEPIGREFVLNIIYSLRGRS